MKSAVTAAVLMLFSCLSTAQTPSDHVNTYSMQDPENVDHDPPYNALSAYGNTVYYYLPGQNATGELNLSITITGDNPSTETINAAALARRAALTWNNELGGALLIQEAPVGAVGNVRITANTRVGLLARFAPADRLPQVVDEINDDATLGLTFPRQATLLGPGPDAADNVTDIVAFDKNEVPREYVNKVRLWFGLDTDNAAVEAIFLNVFTHEFGHALGLAHTNNNTIATYGHTIPLPVPDTAPIMNPQPVFFGDMFNELARNLTLGDIRPDQGEVRTVLSIVSDCLPSTSGTSSFKLLASGACYPSMTTERRIILNASSVLSVVSP